MTMGTDLATRAELVKLARALGTTTDGVAGIRVSHNSDAVVTGFAVSK